MTAEPIAELVHQLIGLEGNEERKPSISTLWLSCAEGKADKALIGTCHSVRTCALLTISNTSDVTGCSTYAPGHLHRIVIHVQRCLSGRDGAAVSTRHLNQTAIGMIHYKMELQVFQQI
jgi:hypothetical protein